jgi:hypothetical protein
MIAPRFAPALCLLAGLALVPTVIHSYAGVRVADDRTVAAIPETLAGFPSTPSERSASWGQRRFESFDWMERRYSADGHDVMLTVIRTYDPKSVYHHPELAIAYGTSFFRSEVVRFPGHPTVPVHVLRADDAEVAQGAAALYVLHYGDEFVADPVMFQVRLAGALLFSGRRPMTVLFAQDAAAGRGSLEKASVTQVLLAAVDAFSRPAPRAD